MIAFSKKKQALAFFGWVGLCFVASGLGAIASVQAKSFYGELSQPSWAPPSSVFAPVWTALYLMMAIAAWQFWRSGGFAKNRNALFLFLGQLAVNAIWSWLFFAWQLGAWAFFDIVILWVLLVATIVAFWRVSVLAGALLIPYLLWVSFAAALNYSVWQLNPLVLG